MCPRKLARRSAFFALLPLALSGCGGASFDDPSILKGLRILAVEKSAPYPKPAEDVALTLLFWDGKSTEDSPRDVHIYFSKEACENPPGDLYYNCLSQLGQGFEEGTPDGSNPDRVPDAGTPDAGAPDGGASDGGAPLVDPRTTPGFVRLTRGNLPRKRTLLPSDFVRAAEIDGAHEASPHGALPLLTDINHTRGRHYELSADIIQPRMSGEPYGIAYVLFAACPGHLGIVSNAGPDKIPLGCFDDVDNHQYDATDFVLGYAAMYSWENRVNNNPIVHDFLFERTSIVGSNDDDTLVRHVPACKASDRTQCPTFPIQLDIDRSSAEVDDDPAAVTPDGQKLHEQMWANFYATRGEFKSSTRLVNDATTGWNDDNGTDYSAPAEPGTVRVFAVVHDNRGGVAWREGKIIVDE